MAFLFFSLVFVGGPFQTLPWKMCTLIKSLIFGYWLKVTPRCNHLCKTLLNQWRGCRQINFFFYPFFYDGLLKFWVTLTGPSSIPGKHLRLIGYKDDGITPTSRGPPRPNLSGSDRGKPNAVLRGIKARMLNKILPRMRLMAGIRSLIILYCSKILICFGDIIYLFRILLFGESIEARITCGWCSLYPNDD